MTLRMHASLQRGDFGADITVDAAPGAPLALVGANGTGKTSILHALAGIAPIKSGTIACDPDLWDEPATGTFVAPEARRAGMVFQDHRLFAHLSARENVAFGLRAHGADRRAADRDAGIWLERVGQSARADARPPQLSRGQASMVALARALAIGPRVLLLDEPFAALDVATKAAARAIVREHLAAFDGPAIIVTHDPLDAFALAGRIAVVEGGAIVQQGTPDEIRARPASRFVADLIGVNWFRGTAAAGGIDVGGVTLAAVHSLTAGTDALAVVHPRAVSLHVLPPGGSTRNVFRARIRDVVRSSETWRVTVDAPVPLIAEVTPAGAATLSLEPGAIVYAAVKATEVAVFPA